MNSRGTTRPAFVRESPCGREHTGSLASRDGKPKGRQASGRRLETDGQQAGTEAEFSGTPQTLRSLAVAARARSGWLVRWCRRSRSVPSAPLPSEWESNGGSLRVQPCSVTASPAGDIVRAWASRIRVLAAPTSNPQETLPSSTLRARSPKRRNYSLQGETSAVRRHGGHRPTSGCLTDAVRVGCSRWARCFLRCARKPALTGIGPCDEKRSRGRRLPAPNVSQPVPFHCLQG